jgi:hypothetical protein
MILIFTIVGASAFPIGTIKPDKGIEAEICPLEPRNSGAPLAQFQLESVTNPLSTVIGATPLETA